MAAVDDLRDGLAEACNVLADEFLPGVTVDLCIQNGSFDEFTSLLPITTARFFEYSNYRQNLLLEIADDDAEITIAMATATYLKIGDDYWQINKADTVPPTGTNPVWQIFAVRFTDRKGNFRPL